MKQGSKTTKKAVTKDSFADYTALAEAFIPSPQTGVDDNWVFRDHARRLFVASMMWSHLT